MSTGTFCICKGSHEEISKNWRVNTYRCNYSAFSGGHKTPSDYSGLWCTVCLRPWRTKASYVYKIYRQTLAAKADDKLAKPEAAAGALCETKGCEEPTAEGSTFCQYCLMPLH